MRKYVLSGIMAAFAVCCTQHPAWSLMVPLSTQTLASDSESVVTGAVEDVKSCWDNKGQSIVTRATIKVDQVVRGEVEPGLVEIEYMGGKVGDLVLKVSDSPSFEKGQEVVVFLKHTDSGLGGGAYKVVGQAQGKYTVGADGIARKEGFSVMNTAASLSEGTSPGTVAGTGVIDNDIPVATLIEKIKAVK